MKGVLAAPCMKFRPLLYDPGKRAVGRVRPFIRSQNGFTCAHFLQRPRVRLLGDRLVGVAEQVGDDREGHAPVDEVDRVCAPEHVWAGLAYVLAALAKCDWHPVLVTVETHLGAPGHLLDD